MTGVKGAIRVCELTRDKVSGMKRNADGVCVMSGYEELLRDGKFSVAKYVHFIHKLCKTNSLAALVRLSRLHNE